MNTITYEHQIAYLEYSLRKNQLKKLWEDTPHEIRSILYGDEGIYSLNWDHAVRWLILPHHLLDDLSPAEVIANGNSVKVSSILKSIRDGLPL